MLHDISGQSENYKGIEPNKSPTILDKGVFGFCNGGIPEHGSLARLPGKTLRDAGEGKGGALSIYQFGQNIVVQRYIGIEIYRLIELAPNEVDFVTDNFGVIVYDSFGIAITQ